MSIEGRPLDELSAEMWDIALENAELCGFDKSILNRKMLVAGQIGSVMNVLAIGSSNGGQTAEQLRTLIDSGIAAHDEKYPES